jgi:pilus assembly protein Flp/PilA
VNVESCPPTCRGAGWQRVRSLLGDQDGAIAIEYGLIAALIVVVILGSIKALGANLSSLPLAAIVAALS